MLPKLSNTRKQNKPKQARKQKKKPSYHTTKSVQFTLELSRTFKYNE